jgi:hypothetical protein
MLIRIAILLCFATSALAQQLPPLDPAVQLGVCQQQRARFLDDSEKASAYANQFLAEIAKLTSKVTDQEAEIAKLKAELAKAP